MLEPDQRRACPTCDRPWSADAFYANCSECKDCKRSRSRQNRAMQARKIAAFERFVDVLATLNDRTGAPSAARKASSARSEFDEAVA